MVQDIRYTPGYTKNPLERSEGAAPSTTLPSQGAAPSEEFSQELPDEAGVRDNSDPASSGVDPVPVGNVVDVVAEAADQMMAPQVEDIVSDPLEDFSPLRGVIDKHFRNNPAGLSSLMVARVPDEVVAPPIPPTPEGSRSVLSLIKRSPEPPKQEAQTGFIRYTNQSATRSLPVSDRLAQSMSFLADMGVTMEVYSGGQESSGKKRVGSTRHDHGDAADVFFYKGDRRLDWGKAHDRPLIQEIVRKARANGITGIGAGPGYMQQGAMHIGFGSEAVWGAGGKASNAPQWLVEAFWG